jgi:hypothetical protein
MENIRIKGNLTPDLINNKLGPFLQALSNLQNTIDAIKNTSTTPIKIKGINWENTEVVESNVWSDNPPVIRVDVDQAKLALARLREAFDSIDEESSNQATRLAQARMIRSICDSFVAAIDPRFEARLGAMAEWERVGEIDDMKDLIRWYEAGVRLSKDAESDTQETIRFLGSRYEEAEKAPRTIRTKREEK